MGRRLTQRAPGTLKDRAWLGRSPGVCQLHPVNVSFHGPVGSGQGKGGIGCGEPVPDSSLNYDAVLLRKEVAEAARPAGARGASPIEVGSGDESPSMVQEEPAGAPAGPTTAPAGAAISALHLRARLPWDKLSDFLRGVVLPLQKDGAELQVEVTLDARCPAGGIRASTLEQNVNETLQQIGAQVLEERAE